MLELLNLEEKKANEGRIGSQRNMVESNGDEENVSLEEEEEAISVQITTEHI